MINDDIKEVRDYLKCTGVGMTEFTCALDSVVSALEKILKEEEPLQELITEYAEQDNRATAYPIYVQVQELVCIGVMEDGYSVNCPFGDGETKLEYKHPDYEGTAESARDIINYFDPDGEYSAGDIDDIEREIEQITTGWIWHPVEFFLTIKGAERYMKANAHNHGKLRTYVSHFERRNFEMRGLLKELGFREI